MWHDRSDQYGRPIRTGAKLTRQPSDALELRHFSPDHLDVAGAEAVVLAIIDAEPCLASVRVSVVDPGQSVRITHVLDAVEPRVRPDGRATFPGVTGPDARAGAGQLNAIDGVLVVPTVDFPGEERPLHEQEGLIDMAGPAAGLTRAAEAARVVVLEFEAVRGAGHRELDLAVRTATLKAAEALARATLAAEPDRVERLALPLIERELPKVVALVQLAALGQLFDVHYHGKVVDSVGLPRSIDPFELIDGAVTSGEYHWAALRNPTISYQDNRLVRALTARHGDDLDFAGLVAMRGYEQSAEDKQRAADEAADAALALGAVGVVITTDAGGNSHTDVMLTVRSCADRGLAATVIVAEMADPAATAPGLTDWVPEADCVISVGNAEELVPAWRPEHVLGGDRLIDGGDAHDAGPTPVRNYLGATCQMGDRSLVGQAW